MFAHTPVMKERVGGDLEEAEEMEEGCSKRKEEYGITYRCTSIVQHKNSLQGGIWKCSNEVESDTTSM